MRDGNHLVSMHDHLGKRREVGIEHNSLLWSSLFDTVPVILRCTVLDILSSVRERFIAHHDAISSVRPITTIRTGKATVSSTYPKKSTSG